ncbi:SDR family NAD(P)-dependent oxidoreductase [Phaeobacter sp. 22II1-1F12B]|uniref:SDR family NAD(P)-dependent oxidoreductase n=1 Tax=Phaeobacter sp. 22II1-1F12B TaxID=1317111 RepID=UPI000B51E9D0|nr:SDR family oxidoreductase [Phaeobacter sp. 22II1-1F12B]OWU82416.1 3-oxoacyl-ACP reductase [Phaeobacter sp. 22II1-1F12B]
MTFSLSDQTAVVFGAGSSGPGWGNGKAAAVAYARAGANVACIDLNMTAAEETAGIIESEGYRAIAIKGNVAIEDDVAAAVATTLSEFGKIEILHNNTGITPFGGPVDLDLADWDRAMDVNVKSVLLASRHVLPHMESQGYGVITNISSIAGIRIAGYDMSAYYTSKAAVNQLTRAIALQYAAKGIRANAILPGLMNTPLVQNAAGFKAHHGDAETQMAERDAISPTGKMGDAWDVAHAAVFLASREAKYINGVLLPVDGGLSCRAR